MMKGLVAGESVRTPTPPQAEGRSEEGARQLLRRAPLFAELDAATVAALSAHSTVVRAPHGTTLVDEGIASNGLIVLVEGSARVSVQVGSGRRATVGVVHAVETFGESCLMDGAVEPLSVQLAGPGIVILLDEPLVRGSVGQPLLATMVLRRLLAAVRETSRRLGEIVELDVQGRVARVLLEAAEGSRRSTVTLTEDDVADLACASRGAVVQAMRNFDRLGWIDRSDAGMCVTDRDRIACLANGKGRP